MAGGLLRLLDSYPTLQEAGLHELTLDDLRGGGYAPTLSPDFIAWQLAALDWADRLQGKGARTVRRVIIQLSAYTQRVGYEGAQVLCFTAAQLAEDLGIKADTARSALKRMTDDANGAPPLRLIVTGAKGAYGSIYAFAPFLEAQRKPENTGVSGFSSQQMKGGANARKAGSEDPFTR